MHFRRLGRTGHDSSALAIGGAAYGQASAEVVEAHLSRFLAAGCNTLDVAPAYGAALTTLGRVLPGVRDRLFVACKTLARDARSARLELEDSLGVLRVDQLDLFQMHAVTNDEELAAVLAPGGAAEALVRAREEGLTRFIGVTGHFEHAPRLFATLLERVDLDTVMLPINAAMLALPDYRRDVEALAELVVDRDLGVFAIKAFARRRWVDAPVRDTWYEPWESRADLQAALDFALSFQPRCVLMLPGDLTLSAGILQLLATHRELGPAERAHEIERGSGAALLGP